MLDKSAAKLDLMDRYVRVLFVFMAIVVKPCV